MKIKKIVLAALALTLAVLFVLSAAACAAVIPDYTGASDTTGDTNVTRPPVGEDAKTAAFYPGNFEIYDYFSDVYGLDADKAYRYKSSASAAEDTAYYFATKQYQSVNERFANYRYYNKFETLAYEPFTFLLESSLERDLGYYAIVFGGEWESKTGDALLAINNAAAKWAIENTPANKDGVVAAGGAGANLIRAIYNFDFKINGGLEIENRLYENGVARNPLGEYDSDIRSDVSQNGAYGSGTTRQTLTSLYYELYKQLTFAPGIEAKINGGKTLEVKTGVLLDAADAAKSGANLINSPSIILIKKTLGEDGNPVNTVVDFADASGVDFSNDAQKTAFTDKAYAIINQIPKTAAEASAAGLPASATGLVKFDYFLYIFGTYAQGSGTALAYARDNAVPPTFFTNEKTGEKLNVQYNNLTDANHVYKFVSYAELVHLLQSDGNFAFYFGGSWCHYSRGFLAPFNDWAQVYNINAVYFFDPYINGSSSATNIRTSETALTKGNSDIDESKIPDGATTTFLSRLYTNLLTYFDINYQSGGFPSTYDYLSNKFIDKGWVSTNYNEDLTVGGKKITKIGVPTLIAYNKDNVDVNGKWQPIVGTASSGDTFEAITRTALEPHKNGVYHGTLTADGKLYNELTDITKELSEYSEFFAVEYAKLAESSKTNLVGTRFYSGVDFLGVVNSANAGRKAEFGILALLDGFFAGRLTRKIAQ